MNDSISRKAAIKAFKDFLTIHDSRGVEYLCSAVTMDGVNKILSDLPSVQLQRWIPVSEALPPSVELVNVSCHDDSGDTAFDYTSCGWITTNGEYWIVDNEINSFVVAWMPLPKPWKGEE